MSLQEVRWPANPDYGQGVFRRRVRFCVAPRSVLCELEDCNHGFRVKLVHNGQAITDITTETLRYPHNSCPQAVNGLERLVGAPLTASESAIRNLLKVRDNCTHLSDMALLAYARVNEKAGVTCFDISVSDEYEGRIDLCIERDGQPVHQWQIRDGVLVHPPQVKDKTLWRGFYAWAETVFSDQQLEAAVMLQRGFFVSQTRRYDYESAYGGAAERDGMPDGVCYSYSQGIVETAYRVEGSVRDFSDCEHELLRFR